MVARHQALTGSFARQLLAVRGSCVYLPEEDVDGNPIPADQRTICGLFKPDRATVVDEYSNITYQEYVLRIRPDGLKALEAGLVVKIVEAPANDCDCDQLVEDIAEPWSTYYVVNVSPERLGWHVVTLQDHS